MQVRRPSRFALTRNARALSLATTVLALSLPCPASVVADAGPTCLPDDALSNAAASLLLAGSAPDSRALVTAVREAGSDAVRVHALYLPHDDESAVRKWLREQHAVADAALICGDARGDAGRLLIASARGGTLLPLTASSSVVRGTLSPGFERPELVISSASGKLTRLGLLPSMLGSGVPLAEDLERPAKIQLVAHGPAGPRPVAERVLEGGVRTPAPGAGPSPLLRGAEDAADAEGAASVARSIASRVSSLRGDHDCSDVRENRLLVAVASRHARDVCESGRLAHELSAGADPETRLRAAGVEARLVGEAIGRAPDAFSAFVSLTESPSHLLTLTERRFTDVGVGVARDTYGRSCVVVLLAAWPRYVGR